MEELIVKYLSRQTTEEEDKILIEWLETSQENLETFCSIKSIITSTQAKDEVTDMKIFVNSLNNIHKRIDQEERKLLKKRIVKTFLYSISAAAATIACAFLLRKEVISKPMDIFANNTETIMEVRLKDGTGIWLDPKSSLEVPKNFSPDKRSISIAGSGYFNVFSDPANPFVVNTGSLLIKVLGTSFCVDSNNKTGKTTVMLESGTVKLQSPKGVSMATLKPGQSAIYHKMNDNLEITETIDIQKEILMKYDLITLEDASIDNIIEKVESVYGVKLTRPEKEDGKHYTFHFQRSSSLESVIKIIEHLTGFKPKVS